MVCICRCSGRGRVRPGGTTGAARGLEGAAAAEVALALNGCRRAPESKRMPPDALPRPAILSKGTAKLTFWPTLSEPTTIPSILASLSTNTPPLDPGDNGAVNCKILYPLPAPGTSSAIRVALRMPEDAVQGKPTAFDTTNTTAPDAALAELPKGRTGSPVAEIRSAASSRRSSDAINSTWSQISPLFSRTCTSRIPFTTWFAVRITPSLRTITPEATPATWPSPLPTRMDTAEGETRSTT